MGLVPKYLLPASWRCKRGFYFYSLHKIKMSKQHRLFILYTISYKQGYHVNHISKVKVFTFLSTHLPVWEQGIPCQLSKHTIKLFFQMSAQVYSFPGQTEGRRKAFLEWGNPQSYLWGEGLMLSIIKVHIVLFLLKEIGTIAAIFKINQYVLLLTQCPGIFSSCPN